jgi:glycosyltransferase involved in cell wall biosynthesis
MMSDRPAVAGPMVSFVVPTFNSEAVLTAALESLAAQTWRDFEVIVSDGASSDGTVAMARSFAGRLPALHVDSRPDTGVYDAINRGVALSRGEWFLVLGSDDQLHAPDTLAQVVRHLRAAGKALMVYGDVRMMAANQTGVPAGGRFAGPMPLQRWFVANVCQQAIFYRRTLFDTLGGFDLRYRLYADWAFNLRAAFMAPPQWVDLVISDYAATGISASASDALFVEEMSELIRSEFAARPGQRELWPAQRHLLRGADALRRRGDWSRALSFLSTYLCVNAQRLPGLRPRD